MVDIAKVLGFQSSERKKNSEARKRVGRGRGSGLGKTCGKGGKGQTARSGKGKTVLGFEGGQTPLYRRMPIHGFNNYTRKSYRALNLDTLMHYIEKGDLSENITISDMISIGLIKKYEMVKLLSKGEITKKITIEANATSKAAAEAIKKAGGSIVLINTTSPATPAVEAEVVEKPKKVSKPKAEKTAEEASAEPKKSAPKTKKTTEEQA